MQGLFADSSGQIRGPYGALINFLRKLESQGGALRRQPAGECHERYLPVSLNLRGVRCLPSFGRKGARWRPRKYSTVVISFSTVEVFMRFRSSPSTSLDRKYLISRNSC